MLDLAELRTNARAHAHTDARKRRSGVPLLIWIFFARARTYDFYREEKTRKRKMLLLEIGNSIIAEALKERFNR